MPKLYEMSIYLFIFLFHFASNKERLFFKLKDTEKYEFTLNSNSDGAKSFYKKLKENKAIPFIFTYYVNAYLVTTDINLDLNPSQSGDVQIGEIYYGQFPNDSGVISPYFYSTTMLWNMRKKSFFFKNFENIARYYST